MEKTTKKRSRSIKMAVFFVSLALVISNVIYGIHGFVYAETNKWYEDYEYELKDGNIILSKYIGSSEYTTVYKTAVIDNVTYKTTFKEGGRIWYETEVKGITLEDGFVLPEDCSELFSFPANPLEAPLVMHPSLLVKLSMPNVDTSNVKNMSGMFRGCVELKEIDVSCFDTRNVTDMSYMFSRTGLKTLDVSSFDTSNVISMKCMFSESASFRTLNLRNFDTLNVKDMSGMFYCCYDLETVELSSFNTENVENMRGMFYICNNLKTLDLSGFNTSKVVNMNSMFYYCSKLTKLDLSSFNTSGVSDFDNIFNCCDGLSFLSTPRVTDKIIPLVSDKVFYDDYNNEYSSIPASLDHSIVLTSYKKVAPSITASPVSKSVIRGNTVKFTVNAEGTDLSYVWYVSKDGGKSWAKSGATGNKTNAISFKATESLNGRKFKCKISNGLGSVETEPVTLTTLAVIKTQPKAQAVNEGDNAKFTVAARTTSAKYQWEVSSDSGKNWSKSGATGSTTNTISFTAKVKQNGYLYRCKVTNGTWTEYSSSVKLTVKKKVTINPPVITTDPVDVTVIRGSKGKLTVKATGTNLKYQWYVSKDGGNHWSTSTATGNKTNTLTVVATESLNGRYFRCKVSNESGYVYSKPAKYTTQAVIRYYSKSQRVEAQSEAVFSVKSRSSVVKYQWEVSSDNGSTWNNCYLSGSTTETLRINAEPGQDGYYYRCKVTNGTWVEYSGKVLLRVTAKITQQPALVVENDVQTPSSVIEVEQNKQARIKIKVYFSTSLYNYQWQESSDNGKTWRDIKDANLSIYSFTPLSKHNGYKYRCLVSNKKNNEDGKAVTISSVITLKVK